MIKINTLFRCDGNICEYSQDLPVKQFRTELRDCNDFYIITTDYGTLWITGDHQIQKDNGVYIYVDSIHVGDVLKNLYCSRAIVTGVTHYQGDVPYKFVKFYDRKHSYDVVEGFFIV